MANLHTIILANTANQYIRNMTQRCIDTLWEYGEADKNEIVVVETQPQGTIGTEYKGAISIYPNEPFNYNKFQNIGYQFLKERSKFDAEYILLANNDLVFHPAWFSSLTRAINSGYDSVSPKSIGWMFHNKFDNTIHEGWGIGHEFAGWCLLFKASSLEKLMPLDEQFEFWCADNDMVANMQKLGMKHALVGDAFVTHLVNQSHHLAKDLNHFTNGMVDRFNNKWGQQ